MIPNQNITSMYNSEARFNIQYSRFLSTKSKQHESIESPKSNNSTSSSSETNLKKNRIGSTWNKKRGIQRRTGERRQRGSEDKLWAYEWRCDGEDLLGFQRTDWGFESAAHRASMARPRKRRRRTAEALELWLDERWTSAKNLTEFWGKDWINMKIEGEKIRKEKPMCLSELKSVGKLKRKIEGIMRAHWKGFPALVLFK